MTRIAVLGLGLLGTGFVEGMLARGGCEVTVWNRSPGKSDALVARGAMSVGTPAEAVRGAARVHLVLLDDESVDSTIASFRDALAPDCIVIDHTTTQPARTAARAAELAAGGVHYLHAPVMMGPGAARTATGMMLAAGPSHVFAQVRDHLSAMTGELWYLGERTDLAAAYKLFGNAAALSVVGVLADVMRLADASGVDRAGVLEMLAKVNLNGPLGMRGRMMVSDTYDTNFTLDVARKDLRLMLETAAAEPTPMLSALASRLDKAIAAGHGSEDFAIIGRRGV